MAVGGGHNPGLSLVEIEEREVSCGSAQIDLSFSVPLVKASG